MATKMDTAMGQKVLDRLTSRVWMSGCRSGSFGSRLAGYRKGKLAVSGDEVSGVLVTERSSVRLVDEDIRGRDEVEPVREVDVGWSPGVKLTLIVSWSLGHQQMSPTEWCQDLQFDALDEQVLGRSCINSEAGAAWEGFNSSGSS